MSNYNAVKRIRIVLALAALFASVFPAMRSSAARTLDLEVFGASVSPKQLIAQFGDVLRFTFTDGTHKLSSYASSGTTIDTGQVRGDANRPSVYQTEFLGGAVWYRCEFHSRIFTANSVCEGMCASISDDDTVPPPPSIDAPTRVIRERPATITGTSVPLTLVTLVEGTTTESGTYRGQALADAGGRWAVQTVDFGGVGGNRSLVARAVSAAGHVSADSPVVAYTYQPDLQNPNITFDPIPVPMFVGELEFSGTATDNVGIRGIRIQFTTVGVNTANAQDLSDIFVLAGQCVPGCPTQSVVWRFRTSTLVGQLPVGIYQVTATAIDTSNNIDMAGAPTNDRRIIFVSPQGIIQSLPQPVRDVIGTPSPAASTVPPVLPTGTPSL